MFYTVQELLAQIKAWEYYIAVLFLATFILYWWALGRAPRRRLRLQPSQAISRPPMMRNQRGTDNAANPSTAHLQTTCWEARQCSPEVRQRCPAYSLAPLPCWFGRLLVSGKVWEPCLTCPIYNRSMARLAEAFTQIAPVSSSPGPAPVKQQEVS